jgi:hypothetical protein
MRIQKIGPGFQWNCPRKMTGRPSRSKASVPSVALRYMFSLPFS